MRDHVTTIDGDEVETRIKAPRQSACLDYAAARADAMETEGGDFRRMAAIFDAALEFLAPHVTIEDVDDVAAWLDERVDFASVVALADRIMAARMPSDGVRGK